MEGTIGLLGRGFWCVLVASGKFNARTPRAPLFCGLRCPYGALLPARGALMIAMLAAFWLFAAATARAQGTPQPIISKVEIIGNQRVEEDAIRIHITQVVGQPLDPAAVTADIKAIDLLGFFSDVSAHVEQQGSQS